MIWNSCFTLTAPDRSSRRRDRQGIRWYSHPGMTAPQIIYRVRNRMFSWDIPFIKNRSRTDLRIERKESAGAGRAPGSKEDVFMKMHIPAGWPAPVPGSGREERADRGRSAAVGQSGTDESHSPGELELEYETSAARGLTETEADRRLAENRREYLTREKKRTGLQSIKQECLDPLFFFLLFLSVLLILAGGNGWQITLFGGCLVFLLKIRQAMRNYTYLRETEKLLLPRIQVLRDGVYRYIDVREIVVGDVLRLKKGQKVPVSVYSLGKPEIFYEKGSIFTGESGRAVAVGAPVSVTPKKRTLLSHLLPASRTLPLRAREMLFQKGVLSTESALLPEKISGFSREKKRERTGKQELLPEHPVVIVDAEYFPSAFWPQQLQKLSEWLRKAGIPLVFFTDKSRKDAWEILRQFHLAEEERDIVDEEQFQCYREEDYRRQRKSIRAYAGLNREEKQAVVEAWRQECPCVCLLPDQNWKLPDAWQERPDASAFVITLAPLHHSTMQRDYYLKGQWSEGILHLLRGAALWNTFQRVTETVQEKALAVLCVLNAAMLLGGIIAQRPETFTGMSLLSAALCGGLALWKELWWQWLRRK